MSQTCNENINDIQKPDYSVAAKDSIELIAGDGIKIIKEEGTSVNKYTISYVEYTKPTITGTVSVGVTKVGVTVPSVVFTGLITPGSTDIISRTMTPDKSLDLTQQFTWTETDVLGTEPGLWPQYDGVPTTVSVEDFKLSTVTKQFGIEYRHLFYMGYSTSDTLDEAGIKALVNQDLLTGILDKYSSYTYNYSVVTAYIYWVFPSGTTAFTEAAEGVLPVPLKLDLANVSVTDEGITKSYRVIRTATKSKFVSATLTLK